MKPGIRQACDSEAGIYVAGHGGMVGSAVINRLQGAGTRRILTASHAEVDLCEQAAVRAFLQRTRPDTVILAAARVGGIEANRSRPAEFIYQNLAIATHVIHEAYSAGVRQLIFLGSSCIYPRMAPQPMTEDALLTSSLETTNEGYALAKIAGLKLCQHYRSQYGVRFFSLMPTNLYGPGDNYHLRHAHVLPALMRKMHEAKETAAAQVEVWGSGRPLREFLHVDDLADAIVHSMGIDNPPDWLNVGSGQEVAIADLARKIAAVVGFTGNLVFNPDQPDGTPRKLLDCSRMAAHGWQAKITLEEGLRRTYDSFLAELSEGRLRG